MATSTTVECGDWLDARTHQPAQTPPTAARRRGFWGVAAVFALVQAGGTLPIPLYVLWQPRFHFDATILTLIFAVYAIGTLLALVLLAPLSDQLGRRPALMVAVALIAVSALIFPFANGVGALLVARFISGIASGIVAATATAALAELEPEHRTRRASLTATAANLGGLGLGALVAGIVAQYGGHPTKLVFWVYLIVLAPAPLLILVSSETVPRGEKLEWRPKGLDVPSQVRGRFAVVAGAIFCSYTLNGLFSSLVPSFLAGQLHEHNHAIAGAISAAIFLIAVASQLLFHRFSPRRALTGGMTMLLVSLGLIELALWDGSLSVFLVGTLAGGIATGLTYMGGIATVNLIAEPEHRAQMVAAFLACAFGGLTIPTVAVGLASQSIGVKHSTLYCAIVISGLATVAFGAVRRGPRDSLPTATPASVAPRNQGDHP